MKIQVTLFHNEGKYRPMSTLIEVESMQEYEQHKAEQQKRALMNIAHQRHTTPNDLIKQGFTKVKVREYNIEKIKEQQEFKHKVNLIKYYEKKRKERKEVEDNE